VETMLEELAPTASAASIPASSDLAERLRHDLEREYPDGPPPGVDLGVIVRNAVVELEGARVKTFVPVLALRAAREALVKRGA
jgi:hypothetical protein